MTARCSASVFVLVALMCAGQAAAGPCIECKVRGACNQRRKGQAGPSCMVQLIFEGHGSEHITKAMASLACSLINFLPCCALCALLTGLCALLTGLSRHAELPPGLQADMPNSTSNQPCRLLELRPPVSQQRRTEGLHHGHGE
jgi:hypothetical protein